MVCSQLMLTLELGKRSGGCWPELPEREPIAQEQAQEGEQAPGRLLHTLGGWSRQTEGMRYGERGVAPTHDDTSVAGTATLCLHTIPAPAGHPQNLNTPRTPGSGRRTPPAGHPPPAARAPGPPPGPGLPSNSSCSKLSMRLASTEPRDGVSSTTTALRMASSTVAHLVWCMHASSMLQLSPAPHGRPAVHWGTQRVQASRNNRAPANNQLTSRDISPSSTVTPSMTTSSARPPRRLRSKLQTQERGGWSSLRGCGKERRPGGGKGASSHCDVRLWKRLTNMVGRAGACHAPSHDRHARVSFRTGGPGHQQANQQGHNDVHAVYKSHHTADRCKLQQRGQEPSCGRQRRQAGFSGRPTGFACHASLRTLSCAQ